MTRTDSVLVLWDIDRTLLYVGDIDRQVYGKGAPPKSSAAPPSTCPPAEPASPCPSLSRPCFATTAYPTT